ncbi:transporter substrate-binding domain-containing protein [Saccharopolyspora spinosa]|uniref:transporter substrate-binding domain-containing protein n=1 Tax=Saccharopolyspora spinosa TaxID=60894 RepID=UPI000237AEA2|nr:transporter substrate-binding domain-containing protein [Saccharopolyspora spinosa]
MAEIADLVPARIRNSGTLRVAVPDGSAPLASVNDSGQPVGMDVDMANAFGGLMGLKVEITPGSFDSQIPGLQSGKFDIAMGEYYITAARLASVDFVSGWRDYSSFATRADDTYTPKLPSELCGHGIGVLKGSAEEASVQEFNTKSCGGHPMTIGSFPDQAASFLALNSQRIDAVVTGRGPLEAAAAQNKSFKITGEMGGGPTAVAVARTADNADMLKAIQMAYDKLVADGTYGAILKQWKTDYGAVPTATIYTKDSTPPNYS